MAIGGEILGEKRNSRLGSIAANVAVVVVADVCLSVLGILLLVELVVDGGDVRHGGM